MLKKNIAIALMLFFASSTAAFADAAAGSTPSAVSAENLQEKDNRFISGLRQAGGSIAKGVSNVLQLPAKAWRGIRNRKEPERPIYIKINEEIFAEHRAFFGKDIKFRQIEWPEKENPEFAGLPKDVESGKSVVLRASDGENKEDTIFIITGSRHWEESPPELHEYTVTAEEFWRLIRELSGGRANSTAAAGT